MMSRQRRVAATLSAFVVLVTLVAVGRWYMTRSSAYPAVTSCRAVANGEAFELTIDQAVNATTVAAVGKRFGLADHAVTIALAAALQESGLHDLPYGDRDSVGLFQQRPSQGWGTRDQILDPGYATAAFYRGLRHVPGWETMAVTKAAQAVQHSAAPAAYAKWETEARVVAMTLTGEASAGFSCRLPAPTGSLQAAALERAMSDELGSPNTGAPVDAARGWTVAGWLVGHASTYQVRSVSFAGRTWTPETGAWRTAATTSSHVQVT